LHSRKCRSNGGFQRLPLAPETRTLGLDKF